MQYVTSRISLVANEPARSTQEATSFAIISAPFPDAIKVSLDQGGYGEFPIGLSLELASDSALYFISTIGQEITVVYGNDGCKVRDSRIGATDENGNVLVQLGNSDAPTFSLTHSNPASVAPILVVGVYGSSRIIRLKSVLSSYTALSICRFTGTPVASGAITSYVSSDATTCTSVVDTIGPSWTVTDILSFGVSDREQIKFGERGAKCITALPGEGLGLFSLDPLLVDILATMEWTEE